MAVLFREHGAGFEESTSRCSEDTGSCSQHDHVPGFVIVSHEGQDDEEESGAEEGETVEETELVLLGYEVDSVGDTATEELREELSQWRNSRGEASLMGWIAED